MPHDHVTLFHDSGQNMVTGAEVISNILSSLKQKGRLANFSQNNQRGECNKRGGWQEIQR